MYQVGECVVHRNYGVVKIMAIESMSGIAGECYLLKPVEESSLQIGLPVSSADAILRKPISKAEAERIYRDCASIHHEWTATNYKEKSNEYKSMYFSMQPEEWLGLIREMYRVGKRGGFGKANNVPYFKKAEELLSSELSYVLELPYIDVRTELRKRLAEV